eukprot:scaffold128558_cov40-Tisochrysis_lutea.AAC.1
MTAGAGGRSCLMSSGRYSRNAFSPASYVALGDCDDHCALLTDLQATKYGQRLVRPCDQTHGLVNVHDHDACLLGRGRIRGRGRTRDRD